MSGISWIPKHRIKIAEVKYSTAPYLFFFLSALLLVSSCQNRPKEVLSRKKMEQLLYDVYLAEATMENEYHQFNTPEKKEAYINRVFAMHGVTPVQWDSSLSWYSDRIDLYLKMNDSVKARLDRARKVVDAEISRTAAREVTDPRSFSPAYIPEYYSFTSSAADRGFRFHLQESELNAKIPGDHFAFTFSVIGIPPRFPQRLASLLALEYRDTTIYLPQLITENKTYETSARKYLQEDTLAHIRRDTLQNIYGYLQLLDSVHYTTHIQLYNIHLGEEHADSILTPLTEEGLLPPAVHNATADTVSVP